MQAACRLSPAAAFLRDGKDWLGRPSALYHNWGELRPDKREAKLRDESDVWFGRCDPEAPPMPPPPIPSPRHRYKAPVKSPLLGEMVMDEYFSAAASGEPAQLAPLLDQLLPNLISGPASTRTFTPRASMGTTATGFAQVSTLPILSPRAVSPRIDSPRVATPLHPRFERRYADPVVEAPATEDAMSISADAPKAEWLLQRLQRQHWLAREAELIDFLVATETMPQDPELVRRRWEVKARLQGMREALKRMQDQKAVLIRAKAQKKAEGEWRDKADWEADNDSVLLEHELALEKLATEKAERKRRASAQRAAEKKQDAEKAREKRRVSADSAEVQRMRAEMRRIDAELEAEREAKRSRERAKIEEKRARLEKMGFTDTFCVRELGPSSSETGGGAIGAALLGAGGAAPGESTKAADGPQAAVDPGAALAFDSGARPMPRTPPTTPAPPKHASLGFSEDAVRSAVPPPNTPPHQATRTRGSALTRGVSARFG